MPDSAVHSSDPRLPQQRGLYYGGGWHESAGGRTIAVMAPATQEPLGLTVDATAEDVDRTVMAARAAFAGWRDTPAQERAKAIRAAAAMLLQHADELAWLEALDTGKIGRASCRERV